jgi:hypothetical protein
MPPTISNQAAGMTTLAITDLINGEPVTINKFLANTNGVIDGGDLLMQRFPLTDGQVSHQPVHRFGPDSGSDATNFSRFYRALVGP